MKALREDLKYANRDHASESTAELRLGTYEPFSMEVLSTEFIKFSHEQL